MHNRNWLNTRNSGPQEAVQSSETICQPQLPAPSNLITLPHTSIGGVLPVMRWLYGMLSYNGTTQDGAFYRIKEMALVQPKYMNLFILPFSQPFYHTDGMVLLRYGCNKINPATSQSQQSLIDWGAVRVRDIDENDWMYFLSSARQLYSLKSKRMAAVYRSTHLQWHNDGWKCIAEYFNTWVIVL